MLRIAIATAALALVGAAGPAHAAGDPIKGESSYGGRCGACHSLERNRIGPMHKGVFGRPAGSAAGFTYSDAVAASDIVWTDETLDAWLTNPEAVIPGQRMFFRLSSATDRADIIAFLKQQSEQ